MWIILCNRKIFRCFSISFSSKTPLLDLTLIILKIKTFFLSFIFLGGKFKAAKNKSKNIFKLLQDCVGISCHRICKEFLWRYFPRMLDFSQKQNKQTLPEFASMPTKQLSQVEVGNDIVMYFLLSFISNLDFKSLFCAYWSEMSIPRNLHKYSQFCFFVFF